MLFSGVSLLARGGEAAPCTKGVNCYCDRVQGGDLNDPSLLLCEDFEAPTLISSSGVGNGAPYYGPWYDATGQVGNRGANSYWTRTYGNGMNGALWWSGTPANPTYGAACGYSLCMNGAWDAADRWQANSFAFIGIMQDSTFNVEVPSLTRPTGRAGGGSGVFDGAASLAQRVGAGRSAGISGYKAFPSPRRTFGITMALAYPNNIAGVVAQPWKHNEWTFVGGGSGGDGLFLFHNTSGLTSQFPFEHFIFFQLSSSGDTVTSCNAKLATATKTVGNFFCVGGGTAGDGAFYFRADPAVYSRPTDFPLSTWACVQGFFQNMGLTNSQIQIWFTGQAGVQKKIIDISNMDTSLMSPGAGGYTGFTWNNYANTNQGGAGVVPTSETTFRYEDNVHIRSGPPVPCSQIGFGAASGGVAPASPTGTRAQ